MQVRLDINPCALVRTDSHDLSPGGSAGARAGPRPVPLDKPPAGAYPGCMGRKKQEVGRRDCAAAAAVCACFNIRKTARAVTRLFDEALEPAGIRSTQFALMASIHAEDTITLPDLARAVGVDRSALTRSLRPLERDGLLKVTASRSAGRSRARLTAKGRRQLARCVPLWREAQERFVAGIGVRRWDGLRADLAAARTVAEEA